MGADGHIRIMDVEKFIADKKLSEEAFAAFFNLIKDSVTYLQKLSRPEPRKRCITSYWGDNLYYVSNLQNLVECGWVKGDWHDPFYFDCFLKEVENSPWPKEEFLSLCRFLWNECHLDEWEVWT